MPLLVNRETGAAENLAQEAADQALQSGSHDLPLNDPEGNPVTASMDQAHDLLAQGYSQPSREQLQNLLDYTKFSGLKEQAKTFAEGAAEAATFGISPAVERAFGVDPSDIRKRREVNPGVHAVGQVAGLAGSALVPGGEAAILGKAGEAAKAAVGLAEPTTALSRIGAAAIKNAAESSIMAAGDETAKMIIGDPDQSVGTAAADIGLSGILGGIGGAAIGSISPLWSATQESKLGTWLSALNKKAGAAEGFVGKSAAAQAAENVGIELAPELNAAMSSAEGKDLFQPLIEAETKAGAKTREVRDEFHKKAQETVSALLGKTPEEMQAAGQASRYEIGKNLGNTLAKEIEEKVGPLSEQYDAIKDRLKGVKLPKEAVHQIIEQVSAKAQGEGWALSPSSDIMKEVERVSKELPNVTTLNELNQYAQRVGENMQSDPLNGPLKRAGGIIKGIIRDVEDEHLAKELGEREGAMARDAYQSLRTQYAEASALKDELDSRLHVRGSTSGYASRLREMAQTDGEAIFRKLSGKGDADLLNLLKGSFPKTAEALRQAHVNDLAATIREKAAGGQLLNLNTLFGELYKNKSAWSPELRDFVLGEADSKLRNIQTLVKSLPERMGPSGTPRTLDALMAKIPGGALSVVAALTGHNPVTGYVLGQLGRLVGREAPDAVKLATLRFLGSGKPISSQAFKTAVELLAATYKGEHLLNAASKSLFEAGKAVVPMHLVPDWKKTKKLDSRLQQLRDNPDPLMDVGGQTPHYFPEHGQSIGVVASTAVGYLNQLRPEPKKSMPLDQEVTPSTAQESVFHRQLQIAEQPLMVLHHVKSGTLTPQDVTTMRTLYPGLYARMNQKLMNHVIEKSGKKEMIPYQTRLGLSLLMGQPLDSTMTQPSIMAMQEKLPSGPMSQGGTVPMGGQKHSMTHLSKLPGMYQTAAQSREAKKLETSA